MAITWTGAAWAVSTAYVLADRVVNGGNVYRCSAAGTSAPSPATGPSGTGTGIVDGSATWDYVGPLAANVADVAGELATAPVGLQRFVLDDVDVEVNDDAWGDSADMGRVMLAAHIATMMLRKGKAGALTGERVGPFSRSYSAPFRTSPAALAQTSYGLEYERLLYLLPAALGDVP